MVKLLKIKGNSNKSNVEIRNHFSDSIRIKPNSKIAVRSAFANLVTVPEAEDFNLPEGANYSWQIQGSSTTPTLVPVPQADYESASLLLRAMQIAGNSTDPDLTATDIEPFFGTHIIWDEIGAPKKSRLRLYKGTDNTANYSTDWIWEDETVFTSYDDDSFKLSGLSTNLVEGYLPEIVPLVASKFVFRITNVGNFSMAAGEYDEPNILWGVSINGGNYLAVLNQTTVIDTGIVPAIDDQVFLIKRGPTFNLVIRDSGGNPKLDEEYTLNSDTLATQALYYHFSAPGTSTFGLDRSTCYTIPSISPTLLSSGVSSKVIDANLLFTRSNASTKVLATYLGFHEESYKTKGDPAEFTSETPIKGNETFPGVMLTIDGLDLDTYNGTSDTYPQQLNILDVIYPEEKLTKLRYVPPYPMRLDMKNPNEIVIRDITLHFAREDGKNIKYLEFTGSPVITLEIADPGEYLD